ncbi:SRPBCC family protein [Actinomadura miaoliensis]|uniref:SRPBCC family protein n=1 Tax=Actinomadura miaoliensis TaxID=430685 RepID=A0ABP7VUH2_9ACTN
MELDHEFAVPVPVDRAWSVLLDVERVAQCVPGATLDSAEDGEYAGRLRVKVGAMTVTYRGTARIVAADESARSVTIEASGKEARGPGTASATVQARLHDEGGTTRVTVHTKLNVTGRPAQFGRNILSEVGAKLIGRFAEALAEELESSGEGGAPAAEDVVDQQGAAEEAAAAQEQKAQEQKVREREDEPQATAEAPEPALAPDESAEPQKAEAGPVPQQRPPSEARRERPLKAVDARPRREQEPIDLLEVAGPSVAKRAVPAVAAMIVLLLAVRFLVRRRRRGGRR